jgi:TonB family protein
VDFSGYSRDLMATLKRRWIASMPESFYSGEAGVVDIRVQVRADGTFVNPTPKIGRSSTKDALDAAAMAAVRASAPFPHFPSGFDGATIELEISFFTMFP